jgi:hypothetical protein
VIWLAPLFRVVGGGDVVSQTIILTALTDVYTSEDRSASPLSLDALKTYLTRRIMFARVASVAIACEILSPLVGTALMLKDPWIAVFLGFGSFILGASATLALLPETLVRQPSSEDALEACNTPKTQSFDLGAMRDRIPEILAVFRQSIVTIFAIRNVVFLMFGFFVATIGTMVGMFKLQYLHKRFGWSYSYVSLRNILRWGFT